MQLFKIDWNLNEVISEEYSEEQISELNSNKDYVKNKYGYLWEPYWINNSLFFDEEYAKKILKIMIEFSEN